MNQSLNEAKSKPMNSVAIQGIRGSYSEEAAGIMLGKTVSLKGYKSFFETFEAMLLGHAEFAVVPMENSVVGEISSVTEFYRQSNLKIIDRLKLNVEHALIGTHGAILERVRSVISHAEALKQCKSYLVRNRQIESITGSDTGSSVQQIVKQNDPSCAAIGSHRAADIYGGTVLLDRIADQTNNQTTFYLIGQ